ncbi:hypothetical protein [Alteromonas stellipolaris]|uniref:hypothetical protein n=1 Tax=Alteromonas stellipolaris TaxID=233316 RepID=UPI0026E3DE25|nr:hypothetical protein [Alteromonas stellipolaris]MDO6536245.1 hypothetical protein [Alteromonas stellipolaris]MDO6627780.1 hypothetical protein [Alteromonas stellipolaris]
MSDEELYLTATNEVEAEDKLLGLWAKAMTLSEGDEEKAKYKYIKLRVEQLTNKQKNAAPRFTKKTVDEFDLKYMPVEEFAILKCISTDKVIKMIRDGFYVGQIKNEKWYVNRDEVRTNEKPKTESIGPQKKDGSKKEYIPVEEFSEYKGITSEKAIAMIRDGFYQGQIIDDKWHVSYSEVSYTSEASSPESRGFFSKLTQGDYGLPKTYWLFGVLGNLLFIFPIALATAAGSISIMVLALIACVVYSIVVAGSIWRASDKYLGPKVWAVLAKLAVILGMTRLFFELISLDNL